MKALALALLVASCVAASASTGSRFELPYDLAVARDGTIFFTDRSRVLAVAPKTGVVRTHARVGAARELAGLARLRDGTVFVADLPTGRIFRVARNGKTVTRIARVPMPVDVVADATGSVLWVASIAEGVGLVRVEVSTGLVAPFADVAMPHGVAHDPNGDFVVHDGKRVSRVDSDTANVTPLADVDAFKLAVASDGSVYGATGTPSGGRIVRISPSGRVTPVAGTGRLGSHRDGRALAAPMLPSAVEVAPDGSLIVAQIEPVPAIRRIELRRGRISTVALGR